MRTLTEAELDEVNGAGWEEAAGAFALIGAIGSSTFGGSGVAWGAVAFASAWAAAPVAVVAIGALSIYAGVCLTMD